VLVQRRLVALYPFIWWWRRTLPERRGQACRIVARGRMNSILIEFRDGVRVVTSRYAVRYGPGRKPGT
jgi:hypothetical protein